MSLLSPPIATGLHSLLGSVKPDLLHRRGAPRGAAPLSEHHTACSPGNRWLRPSLRLGRLLRRSYGENIGLLRHCRRPRPGLLPPGLAVAPVQQRPNLFHQERLAACLGLRTGYRHHTPACAQCGPKHAEPQRTVVSLAFHAGELAGLLSACALSLKEQVWRSCTTCLRLIERYAYVCKRSSHTVSEGGETRAPSSLLKLGAERGGRRSLSPATASSSSPGTGTSFPLVLIALNPHAHVWP